MMSPLDFGQKVSISHAVFKTLSTCLLDNRWSRAYSRSAQLACSWYSPFLVILFTKYILDFLLPALEPLFRLCGHTKTQFKTLLTNAQAELYNPILPLSNRIHLVYAFKKGILGKFSYLRDHLFNFPWIDWPTVWTKTPPDREGGKQATCTNNSWRHDQNCSWLY